MRFIALVVEGALLSGILSQPMLRLGHLLCNGVSWLAAKMAREGERSMIGSEYGGEGAYDPVMV